MYRHTTNVDHGMYDYTGNNWSHHNSHKRFKENLKAISGKHSTDSLQKTAISGKSHVIQKVLPSDT
jgi:phosphoribosylformylglycinamidine (FGAM) synthase-like enzyme